MVRASTYTDNVSAFIRWMNNLTEPVDQDLRSAIWKTKPDGEEYTRAEVREHFLQHVRLTGSGYSEHMMEREQKELERFLLPWSERPAWKDWGPTKVRDYFEPRGGDFSTLEDDIAEFKSRYGVSSQPYPIRKVWHRLPGSTSSGLPWLQGHWKQNIGSALMAEVEANWNSDSPRDIPPSMPMWRVDPPGKVRFAWAESKYEALYGSPFTYPLVDKLRELPATPFIAWKGPDYTATAIGEHMRSGPCEEYLSIDYSSYDQTQSPFLVRKVMHDLVHPMVGSAKPGIFNAFVENLVSGNVVTPEGEMRGEHGVPSGSVATNLIDSLNNALCIIGYLRSYGVDQPRFWVQGDDALICGHGVNPTDFANFARKEYGFVAHPEKQSFGVRMGDFLQMSYYAENDWLPTYPAARVGWRMIGHERFKHSPRDWNQWAVVVRAIQQLQNAYYHPDVEGLIAWAGEGDKLRLGAGLPPRQVLRNAGIAGYEMTKERTRWDPGAEDRDWTALPIQQLIQEELG